MGCGDGNSACRQARIEPVHYQSIRACRQAVPAALAHNSDVDHPVIAATCQATGQLMVQARTPEARRG